MTEDELYQTLFERMPPDAAAVTLGPGDDCAALQLGGDDLLLVTVDQLVGERHYVATGADAVPPQAVGRKLLARNLSDIAAMGGCPTQCVVACTLGPHHDEAWWLDFMAGIQALAAEFSVGIIGGDVARAPNDQVASLTLLGRVSPTHLCRRSGAQAGDRAFVTGAIGDAVASGHHLTFTPRCREGQWLLENGFAHAMIDLSDGLLLDAARVCRASGLALELETEAVPLRNPQQPREEAMREGEDYELFVAVPRDSAAGLHSAWPFTDTPLTDIGGLCSTDEPGVYDTNGNRVGKPNQLGYDHLTS